MSDYFGALMRASGILPGGAMRGAVPPSAPGPLDVGMHAPAPDVSAASRAPQADPHEFREGPRRERHAVAPPAAGTPASPDAHTAAALFAPAPVSDQPEAPPPFTPAAQPAATAARGDVTPVRAPARPLPPPAAGAPRPVDGHTLVQLAMQWVAGDPHAADVPGAEPRPPAAARAPTPPATSPGPMPRAPQDAPRTAVATAPAVPVPPADAYATAAQPLRAPVREERIDVSIGEIHLRIDAPASHTIERAPAPPAAPAAPAVRDNLARRALRRI